MSRVSFPVTRPTGRALLVGHPAGRAQPLIILRGLGFACDETDEVYSAIGMLCQLPGNYQAVVLSLASLYPEELGAILSIKRHSPRMEVWLAQADGRQPLVIEAVRLGADGVLADDGLHRVGAPNGAAVGQTTAPTIGSIAHGASVATGKHEMIVFSPRPGANGANRRRPSDGESKKKIFSEMEVGEPVLSADELRALLQEQPFLPPHGDEI